MEDLEMENINLGDTVVTISYESQHGPAMFSSVFLDRRGAEQFAAEQIKYLVNDSSNEGIRVFYGVITEGYKASLKLVL